MRALAPRLSTLPVMAEGCLVLEDEESCESHGRYKDMAIFVVD